ncbi:hypothetical protein EJV47_06440 [Hymenobacter gummosus]|uniref:Carboxypeptidase regulatory-like domain-containing protein n=1 Tax=Hymenobacter gummosus TaxID=1776032 RepID=A0A431U5G6_9BACT|nr:hypothetical protein [Hymenobacter gummosus]RTQ51438.1 hypothetical protein EJV47_06440 [Hymenobacter gummosus]
MAPDAATGAFGLPSLAPGTYSLSFTPASGYRQPASRSISIVAGATTDAGTVTVASDGSIKGGSVSWTVNGVTHTGVVPTGSVDVARGDFTFLALATQTEQLRVDIVTTFRGVGTYNLNIPFASTVRTTADYVRTTGGTTSIYGNTPTAGSGSITVTAFDANAGTAAGTFSFTLVGLNNTPGSVNVTDGRFSLRF